MTALETSDSAVEFLIRFVRVGHEAGYPTADLEDRSGSRSIAWTDGRPGLRDADAGRGLARIAPAPAHVHGPRTSRRVDLDAIARADDLVQDVLAGRLDPDAGLTALADIKSRPLERPWPLLLAAYAIAGAALTPVLGGGSREIAASTVVGLLVGAIALPATRTPRTEPMAAPLAAVTASFCRGDDRSSRPGRVAQRRDARRARDVSARHETHDRHARAVERAPPVRGREHGERSRPATRARLRGRGWALGRGELVRRDGGRRH